MFMEAKATPAPLVPPKSAKNLFIYAQLPYPAAMKRAIHTFLKTEASAGLILIATTVLALIAANTALEPAYHSLLNAQLLNHSLTHWVNDALMAIFFLFVGLEVKKEILNGNLATWPQRLLPTLGAAGGMLVPALVYLFINRTSPATIPGWAIPTATDIAFALGILALVPRAPVSLKIFLTALAILDDLGAILLIALLYTTGLAVTPFILSAILIAALITFNRNHVTSLWPYLVTGTLLWLCVYQSGLHPTMAGVILALTIPLKSGKKLEHALAVPTAYLILPVFAFFNAGISFAGISLTNFTHPVTLGIFAGLLVGKQLGVGGALLLATKLFKIPKPAGATTLQLYAVSLLCGIGFTMSLFIGNLALPASYATEIRLAILSASLVCALAAFVILTLTPSKK